MLTVEKLKAMKPGTIFDNGVSTDSPSGIHFANTGHSLRWVACRGKGFHDWAIYVGVLGSTEKWIQEHGDKLHNMETIKKLVAASPEAYELYRK